MASIINYNVVKAELLANSPIDWPTLVKTAHEQRFLIEPSPTPTRNYVRDQMYSASNPFLEIMWRRGFALVVARCVMDVYFCGFSKEELMSPLGQEAHVHEHIEWLLELCSRCLYYLDHAPPSIISEVQDEIDFYELNFPPLWRHLWDIRTPFLDSDYASRKPRDSTTNTVHNCLGECIGLANRVMEKYRGVKATPENSYAPHVMAVIWIHTEWQHVRWNALNAVCTMCSEAVGLLEFHCEFADGFTAPDKIVGALIRDLKDECLVDREVYSAVFVTLSLRVRGPVQLKAPLIRELMWSLLSASCRQLCRGDPNYTMNEYTFPMMFSFLQNAIAPHTDRADQMLVPEVQVYRMVSLLSHCIVSFITETKFTRLPKNLELTPIILRALLSLRGDTAASRGSTSLRAIRQYTRRVWLASVGEINERRLLNAHTDWQELVTGWKALGRLMPASWSDSTNVKPPGVQRCNWQDCLCSVFKPAHQLRVCKGCWVVAYCSARCQLMDWGEGNHSQSCRRRKSRPRQSEAAHLANTVGD